MTPTNAPSETEITALLRAWGAGDRKALETVMPLVYRQLQATAHAYMNQQQPAHLLQSTALVNETYLRLLKLKQIEWQDRGHFYAVCAQLMRQTLVDYARSRLSQKRGGARQQVPIEDAHAVQDESLDGDLIALDEALRELSAVDERMSQVVQYRVFVGASVEETAVALHISEATVKREWQAARLWLAREMDRKRSHGL
jgi:RNA polymerase sigma-70 factor, ECF subfamily